MSGVIESLERAQLRRVPSFQAGDRAKVHFQVVEGTRRRTQVFEGVGLKRQRRGGGRPRGGGGGGGGAAAGPRGAAGGGGGRHVPAAFAEDRADRGGEPRRR